MGVGKGPLRGIPAAQDCLWRKGAREKGSGRRVNISRMHLYTSTSTFVYFSETFKIKKNLEWKNDSKFVQEENPFLCGELFMK